MLVLTGHPFTPGCYYPKAPYNTYCVPEPYGKTIDGLGDRLSYRLAYRYITGTTSAEYLAVTHTVQENSSTRRTGIRYYKLQAGKSPKLAILGELQDTTNNYFLSMPSVAMDKNGDLGITYTVTGWRWHQRRARVAVGAIVRQWSAKPRWPAAAASVTIA